jgi:phenylpropionate dioxygenase-like ring-hydroxylating dioxygenase large terminal subunit
MLTREDNERVVRVGPGTEMGNLMRQYWVPALASSELPGPDCDPVRVLLLGEQLVAFRDTSGRVGLLAHSCPHRGASLYFGRNEDCGLRCVYHGWKFDVEGNCADMPNEPAESNFRTKVKAVAYPCQERGGVIWAYLGPRAVPPPLPDIEATMLAEGEYGLRPVQQQANWLQVLEGDIDTSHFGFLHMGSIKWQDQPEGTFGHYALKDRAPRYKVIDTPYGTMYGAYRGAEPGHYYWRIAQFLFPFYSMAPGGVLGLTRMLIARVPMDDEHTMNFFWFASPGRAGPSRPRPQDDRTAYLPNAPDWYGRWRTKANLGNDFLIDRDQQRANAGNVGFTGLAGQLQDQAIVESMGPVFDRSQEHLGTADAMIIRTRKRMLDAASALAERGTAPPGVDEPEVYRVRSGGVVLPVEADWIEATRGLVAAFVDHPELDPSVGANA